MKIGDPCSQSTEKSDSDNGDLHPARGPSGEGSCGIAEVDPLRHQPCPTLVEVPRASA